MRRQFIALACIFITLGAILWVIIYDGYVRPPEKMERDPDSWQTYRAYVNHGIAAREAGEYGEAMKSLLYAYQNAPHSSRMWLIATVNLGMCCEVLGQDEVADKYYRDAGKFCTLANNMRTGGAWRRMRMQVVEENAKKQGEMTHE